MKEYLKVVAVGVALVVCMIVVHRAGYDYGYKDGDINGWNRGVEAQYEETCDTVVKLLDKAIRSNDTVVGIVFDHNPYDTVIYYLKPKYK